MVGPVIPDHIGRRITARESEQVKALRWFGRRDMRLTVVDEPQPRAGEVLLRVSFCGICGTDLDEYVNGPVLLPTQPHPLTGASVPLTLGHEFSGTVTAVGAGVTALSVGAKVVPEVCLSCGTCRYCREGHPALCESWGAIGLHVDGGLAEFVRVPADSCVPLAAGIDEAQGALIEPLEVAVRAVRRAQIVAGSSVIITGAGPIGLLVMQVARTAGADPIVVVEPRPARARFAAGLDANAFVISEVTTRAVAEALGGSAADIAIECSGRSEAVQLSIESVRKRGRVVLVGIPPGPATIDLLPIIVAERELLGSIQHEKATDLKEAVSLLNEGAVELGALISDVVPLSEAVAWFERLAAGQADSIKVLIDTQS
jgi:(R,R)-butanediol dehydrogenase / meso-butanediol dehydrogenase / diacetyl reductase